MAKLIQYVELRKGKPQKITNDCYFYELPYLTPEYLRNDSTVITFRVSQNSVIVSDNDLIVLWDGSNAGEVFYAKSGILSSTMVHLIIIRPIEKEYLYYFLKHQETYLRASTSGSGIPHVDKKLLQEIIIPDISLTEQKAIVEVLTRVDESLENINRIIHKYSRLKSGMMQDLLTKGIAENGELRSTKKHIFKDSLLGKIPEEWDVVKIKDLIVYMGSGITPRGGESVYQSSGIMFLRSQNILWGEFDLSDVAYISDEINVKMKRSQLKVNDVLLNITGASIGRSHFVDASLPEANVNQHVCAIRIKTPTEAKAVFLSNYLNSSFGQIQIKKLLGGSNREGLNYSQIKEIAVPWPSDPNEFTKFADSYFAIQKTIKNLNFELEKFTRLKNGLMQDLLTGKVRLTEGVSDV